MSWRRMLLLFGAVALMGVGAGIYLWQWRAADERAQRAAIQQEVVARGTIVSTVSATGLLAPRAQINLFFAVPSLQPVVEVNVVMGQSVRQGEVLARLDTRGLELEVAQAEHALRAARLALSQLQAPPRPEDMAVAEANLRLARAQVFAASQGNRPADVEVARLNLLLAQNALNQTYQAMDLLVAQGDLGWLAKNALLQPQADQQVAEAKVADEQYRAAQRPPGFAAAASALAAVEQAQVTLDRLRSGPLEEDRHIAQLKVNQAVAALDAARYRLAHATIVAPFDGIVAAVNITPGEIPTRAVPAVVLADVSRFFLDVAVDELDIARIRPGQTATVTLDALPAAVFAGHVESIALAPTNSNGVVSYAVHLPLHPLRAPVRSGMTATADIVVAEARAAVLVPNWAIRRDRDTGLTYAGVLRNGQIDEVVVTLGLRNENVSEVLSGLTEGDVVAVSTVRERFRLLGDGQ